MVYCDASSMRGAAVRPWVRLPAAVWGGSVSRCLSCSMISKQINRFPSFTERCRPVQHSRVHIELSRSAPTIHASWPAWLSPMRTRHESRSPALKKQSRLSPVGCLLFHLRDSAFVAAAALSVIRQMWTRSRTVAEGRGWVIQGTRGGLDRSTLLNYWGQISSAAVHALNVSVLHGIANV